MTNENYKLQLEQLLEDNNEVWPDSQINRLVKRATQLQHESDFTVDDIEEELSDIVSDKIKNNDQDEVWFDIVQEFAIFVYDEKENIDDDDETVEEED